MADLGLQFIGFFGWRLNGVRRTQAIFGVPLFECFSHAGGGSHDFPNQPLTGYSHKRTPASTCKKRTHHQERGGSLRNRVPFPRCWGCSARPARFGARVGSAKGEFFFIWFLL